jgi:hypothetical protein
MFLRSTNHKKDGKDHRYFSISRAHLLSCMVKDHHNGLCEELWRNLLTIRGFRTWIGTRRGLFAFTTDKLYIYTLVLNRNDLN